MTVSISVINNAKDRFGVGRITVFPGLKTEVGVVTRLTASGKSFYVQTKDGERLYRGMDHTPCVVERVAVGNAEARKHYTSYK